MSCTSLQLGFRAVAPLWNALLERSEWSTVFLTPEWQEGWWEQFGKHDAELYLLVVGAESDPLGIAPMALHGDRLTFIGDTDLFDYHDFITADARFYPALADCLDGEPWRTMDLRSVPGFSPTMAHLPDVCRARGWDVSVESEDVVPGVALPATWDEYLGELRKKDRHELRRKLRRLEQRVSYRVVQSGPETLEADVSMFLDLMRESREEKRVFLQPEREEFFRRIVDGVHGSGRLHLSFLEVQPKEDASGGADPERVAAVLAFDYHGHRLLYNSGYRLAYAPLSVGLLLKALCIKDAIEHGLTYFDFLRGPEPYKYHLGAEDVTLHRIVVRR